MFLMAFEVRFKEESLDKLERDAKQDAAHPTGIGKAFRKRMQQIRGAKDERDFYALKSLRFEKLKGQRAHQHSMRLNDQWRLIVEIADGNPSKVIVIVGIEDYH
jgi:proteic killer suppression protein